VTGLNRDAARRLWPLALGVVLGVLAGILVSLLGSSTRRAEASVLISSSAGQAAVTPMLPNLRELATSGVVAANVRSTLRLNESTPELRRQLHATVRPQSEVIAISATDEVADHARQIAQEATVVFAQLVDARFGAGEPALHAAVLDSAHVLGGPDRHFVRNGLIGALVGLLLGSASLFVLASGTRQVVAAGGDDHDLSKREGLLDKRVKGVTARERALADRAGKLAAREQELDARAAKLTAAEREVGSRAGELASSRRELADRAIEIAASKRELEAITDASPPPVPEPVSTPEAEAEPALPTRAGTWNLNELQRAVDAYADATPEQAENWRTYLYFVREHASPDGTLPRSFDPLISDIFGEALERSARGSRE
jgi:capsular polysaccharide biosynthesis protein